ncbi:hypothetical protein AB0A67_39735, partial [Streptomyces eurythermus]
GGAPWRAAFDHGDLLVITLGYAVLRTALAALCPAPAPRPTRPPTPAGPTTRQNPRTPRSPAARCRPAA